MSANIDLSRPLEEANENEPPSKRVKLASGPTVENENSPTKTYDVSNLLPASTSLLRPQIGDNYMFQGSEKDVGITEYISHDVASIDGIIKQRYVSNYSI